MRRNKITIKDPIGSYNITNADIPKKTTVSVINKIEALKTWMTKSISLIFLINFEELLFKWKL